MKFKDVKEFTKEVTKQEKGKKQISIAQVSEVLKVINTLIPGFYDIIMNGMPKPKLVRVKVEAPAEVRMADSVKAHIRSKCALWEKGRKRAQDGDEIVKLIKESLV